MIFISIKKKSAVKDNKDKDYIYYALSLLETKQNLYILSEKKIILHTAWFCDLPYL